MQEKRKNAVESLFVLLLFSLFAITSLLIVTIGSNIYHSIVEGTDTNSAVRSSLSYVSNKVRAADSGGNISIQEQDGMEVLIIRQTIEGMVYHTYIYYQDGYLWENFTQAEDFFQPEMGEKVLEVQDFQMKQEGSALHFRAAGANDSGLTLSLFLRSEPESASEGGGTP